jgi:hypothetical protein
VLANGSWGCSRPDSVQLWRICTAFFQNRAQLWRICALFFGFSLSLPVEAVFKGVQIVHIMLSLDPKGDRKGRPYHRRTGRPLASPRLANTICRWVDHAHGRGRETPSALIYSFPAKRSGSYAWVVQATRSEGRHSGVGQCIRAMGTGQRRRALASRLFR